MTVKEYNRSVEDYADSVYRFIRGNLKDEDRANDIVQDSYERLWKNVAVIEYPVVKTWLFSTSYHMMIDIIRKEKRITNLEPEHEKEMIYESHYSDLNEIIHEKMNGIRKIMKMNTQEEGPDSEDIGQELNSDSIII